MGFFDKLTGVGAEDQKPKKSTSKTSKAKTPKIESEKKIENKNETEGQLTIDAYETENDFIVQSTIAGVKAEDLDIDIEDDMVTIRGGRQRQTEKQTGKYYYQECYWGSFSRQIILPEEMDGSQAEATMKDGVLTLRIPKVKRTKKRKVSVKQED